MSRTPPLTEEEVEEAKVRLRALFPKGGKVPIVLRHVSSSGMSRNIIVLAIEPDYGIRNVSHLVGRVMRGHGMRYNADRGAVVVGGTGMDMGFHLIYELGRVLYGESYALSQQWV